MRHLAVFASALLLAGCAATTRTAGTASGPDAKEMVSRHAAFVKANLSLPDDSLLPVLEGEVIPGMTRDQTRALYGEPNSLYLSPTGMMEVWFYQSHYVGFDKAGRVVKFGRY